MNIKEIQTRLKKLGFYKGSIDGDYGTLTKLAVKKFQIAAKLKPATGNAGPKTQAALKTYKPKTWRQLADGKRHKLNELRCKDGTFPLSAQRKYARANTLKIAEKIEDETGLKLIFVSGYRSYSHNKKVGGKLLSEHLNKIIGGCTAIDLKPTNGDVAKLYHKCKELQDKGIIKGVGKYSTFVHIDKRIGKKASW